MRPAPPDDDGGPIVLLDFDGTITRDRAGNPIVFLDFDGTITVDDTLVLLLDRFGRRLPDGRDWRAIEFDDSLPERVKLQAELDLLEVGLDEALAWLDGASRLRPGFADFLAWAGRHGLQPTVLSGGLLPIIERALGPLRRELHAIHANDLRLESGRWLALPPATPRLRGLCNHCKTWHLREAAAARRPVIYIGDGSTDFCPAREADLVFARSSLATQMEGEGRSHLPFVTFADVIRRLEGLTLRPESSGQALGRARGQSGR
jgi:2,3-diketo-5-methylthio-1-phosphopentane phosphatase